MRGGLSFHPLVLSPIIDLFILSLPGWQFLKTIERSGLGVLSPHNVRRRPPLFSFTLFSFALQFLKTIKRSGLGVAAFYGLRYFDDGSERPDFVLNQAG